MRLFLWVLGFGVGGGLLPSTFASHHHHRRHEVIPPLGPSILDGVEYVDADGLPADLTNYSWGNYARKRAGVAKKSKRSLSPFLHRGGKHPLQSRQDECPITERECFGQDYCCPISSPVCCLNLESQENCCKPGEICVGRRTCCLAGEIGCGEACCRDDQTCCGLRECCSENADCDGSRCVERETPPTLSTPTATQGTSDPSISNPASTNSSTPSNEPASPGDQDKDDEGKFPVGIAAGAGGGAAALILLGIGICLYRKRRNSKRVDANLGRPTHGESKEQFNMVTIPPATVQQNYPQQHDENQYRVNGAPWASNHDNPFATPTAVSSYYGQEPMSTTTYSSNNAFISPRPSVRYPPSSTHTDAWEDVRTQSIASSSQTAHTGLERANTKARYISAEERARLEAQNNPTELPPPAYSPYEQQNQAAGPSGYN